MDNTEPAGLVPVNPTVATPVAVYDRITDPMSAVKVLGSSIFKSGIFGLDKPEQGEILAMQCLVERKSPLELARTYHFINGQLAIKSDALLAKFNQAGGSVNWITRTDELVEAEFTRGTTKAFIKSAMSEYVANGVALGKDGKPKDNWKRWPRRMLTARAISEGVRLVAPECCFGTYTAEEMDVTGVSGATAPRRQTLDEIVPDTLRHSAVGVLRKTGHLTDSQGWADIPEDVAASIAKKPAPFLKAVHIYDSTNV